VELQAWYLKGKQHPKSKEINTLPKALATSDKVTFPNFSVLLQIGEMLALVLLIHRDLTKHLNIDDVDEFAREHPRHMELINCC